MWLYGGEERGSMVRRKRVVMYDDMVKRKMNMHSKEEEEKGA